MKQKLLKIFSINMISALINFLSTILILRLFGLKIFGQFAILSSYIGIFTLIYIIIPSNYAIFKIQDDNKFKETLFFNYIFSSFLIILLIYVSSLFIEYQAFIELIILFSILTGIMSYFDTYLQAFNKLDKYFLILFISYLIKVTLLIILYVLDYSPTLNKLILINIISISISIVFGIKYIELFNIKVKTIKDYFLFLKKNFHTLKSYYVNTILKRLKDNALILIFSNITSNEIIGLYSLFTKIGMFVLGQLRVIEAFFMNRNNLNNIASIANKKILIGFISQILILVVGLIYLKLSTNKFMFFELFIYSFLSYPYIFFILMRNKILSLYKIESLNEMYIVYFVILIIFYIIAKLFLIKGLMFLLIFVLFSEIINVYVLNKRNKL